MRCVLLAVLACLAIRAAPGSRCEGLPARAVILQTERFPGWAHPHRGLILWVLAPADKPLRGRTISGEDDASPDSEDPYTCPEQTLGHFYRAPTRVSLVDTNARRVVNTVPVRLTEDDQYDIPFRIRPGYFYEVPGARKGHAGKPHILSLKDFNGDGKALEFAFYVMESCSGPLTMVMGYSQRQDRVIVYEFLLTHPEPERSGEAQSWMYRFTFDRPVAPMHWKYTDWYNSGTSVDCDFRYFPERERFEGTEAAHRGGQ